VVGADKQRRVEAAHCFCLPSYDEGLPMAMLEAMAAGLAVVVTRVGAIPEAVSDGVDGLLYPAGDVDALRERLQALLDEPDLGRRIGATGRARVEHDFSLSASVNRLLAVYSALGVPVRPAPEDAERRQPEDAGPGRPA
jgi:glycosyltransferase involved in cell wall biosynthesis